MKEKYCNSFTVELEKKLTISGYLLTMLRHVGHIDRIRLHLSRTRESRYPESYFVDAYDLNADKHILTYGSYMFREIAYNVYNNNDDSTLMHIARYLDERDINEIKFHIMYVHEKLNG